MEVVEDDDQRSLGGERLEVPARRPLRLLLRPGDAPDSDRGGDAVGDELVSRDRGDRLTVGAGGRAHDLGERPVGDSFAVGEAAADRDARLVGDPLDELAREA